MPKKVICLFLILLFAAEFFSENLYAQYFIGEGEHRILVAKKERKKKKDRPEDDEEITGPVTAISVTKSSDRTSGFFSGIDAGVMALVENGSPESLLDAYAKIRKAAVDYQDNERVLIYIISSVLRIVWPSQSAADVEEISVDARNAYTGAIDSAKNGIYDTSTGNRDFLAAVLPSLVLCGIVNRPEYYEQAEKDLRTALVLNPKSVLANYLLGLLYSKSGRSEDAVRNLREASEASRAFEISFALAAALNALGRFDESKSITDSLVVLYPSSIVLLKLLARNSYERGDYADAERYAVLVLTQNPSDLEMLLFRAKIFVRTGEYLKATSLLDVYAKANSNAKDYLLLRARVQKEWNRNVTAAVSNVEKALSLYPDDQDVILAAAELAGESGSSISGKTGSELAGLVLKKDPENSQALAFLIKTLVESGKWNEAYSSSKKLMTRPNPSIDTITTHSRICLALRLEDEAWNNAQALYNRLPKEEKAVQLYVEAMVRTGRSSQASRFINSSISDASSSMKSFLYYQRSYLAGGETAQLADLRSAVIANPRNSDALFRMYEIYFQKQDYRKAQYYLRQVIAQNPNSQNYLRLNSELDKLIR